MQSESAALLKYTGENLGHGTIEALEFAVEGPAPVPFTGERYTPRIAGAIRREHHHRYLVAAKLCRGRDVLDVACGEGYGTHLLAQVSRQVVGVDIDAATVQAARLRYPADNVEFVLANAAALPFDDASFDVVTSFETIEHIEEWAKFTEETARVLRPDGMLIISTPNREVYSEQDGYDNPFHVREFDRDEFRNALSRLFKHVVMLEQTDIVGSVLLPEQGSHGTAGRDVYETADGSRYRHSSTIRAPRYFVALASNRRIDAIHESLVIDNSPVAVEPAVARDSDGELPKLRKQLEDADATVRALERRASRAERQIVLLRRSSREWALQSPASAEVVASVPEKHMPSPAEAVERLKGWLRRFRIRAVRYLGQGRARRAFDAAYYLRENADVAEAKVDPFAHFMGTGWREGRDPSQSFLTGHYLQQNPDVRTLGINPLLHFVLYGRKEGRSPHPHVVSKRSRSLAAEDIKPTPLLNASPPTKLRAELIAFYLPQFHAIHENDHWWGTGFTEWTNVRAARPQFVGHDQPRIPGELGYYNLLDSGIQQRQIELAKLYGIGGFCFYFYWFAGKRLLERPVETWLNDKSLDFPFCICWANENWTRRWDGNDTEILIAQEHSAEDDLAFIAAVAPYLRDSRYIRVDGKPILVVYRPSLLPSARKTAERWRHWCRTNGIGEIHLAYTQSFERLDPEAFGFDAAIEFPPNNSRPPDITDVVNPAAGIETLRVFDWRVLHERSTRYDKPTYRLYRGVCPGWDNAARRRTGGTVFLNNTPDVYREWLSNAIADTESRIAERSDRLVFINAWNEWAEGAYLEPDRRYGYAWLQATREAVEVRALARVDPRSVLIVTHDAQPHGAQYLALNLTRAFAKLGYGTHVISLGDGPLLAQFGQVAELTRLDPSAGEAHALAAVQRLRDAGVHVALLNTTVSGWLAPILKQAGLTAVSMVHEMPTVLNDRGLQREAKAIARSADVVVFPARLVREGFENFSGERLPQAAILPQGVIRANPFRQDLAGAHRLVCERHGLAPDTKIVLSVAFVEHRKGPDLFLDMAEKVLVHRDDVVFLWIGHFAAGQESRIRLEIERRGLKDKVRFIGFVGEPLDYYAAASVYALTSREDPYPNVVLESAEVGVPVVAFAATTGAADIIEERGGRLAVAFDCEAFATHVEELLTLPRRPALLPVPTIRQYALDLMCQATGRPRVSVILPNFNYARYLHHRLVGILDQTYPAYEIIVLDDHSSDESLDVLRSFAGKHPECDIRIVANANNSGSVFRQWRKGISLSRGDLIWIAEADDLAECNFLETLVDRFREPDVVLAYCQSRQVDGTGRTIARDYLEYTSDISDAWHADYVRDGSREIADALAVKNTIPNVSAAIFRKSALESALATLGDRLFDYRVAGDWLLYMHVMLQGKVGFVSAALNHHRRHSTSVTSATDARRHFDEVAAMQEEAQSLAPVSSETRGKASAWLAHVRNHLGLACERLPVEHG